MLYKHITVYLFYAVSVPHLNLFNNPILLCIIDSTVYILRIFKHQNHPYSTYSKYNFFDFVCTYLTAFKNYSKSVAVSSSLYYAQVR